jgi:hypothetical protein
VKVKLERDQKAAARFTSAIQQLQRISGRDFETVIKHELGAMLSSAVKSTKKATVNSIQASHAKQPGASYDLQYQGPTSRTGKVYTPQERSRLSQAAAARRAKGKRGRLVYYLGGSNKPKQYPDWLWSRIAEFRRTSLENKKKARGLAASMFVKIGAGLGIPVKAPAYLQTAAHHKKGDMTNLLELHQKGSGNTYEIGFINRLTHMNRWAGASLAFRKALNARANYMSRAVKLEAEKKIKRVLDRYPGLAKVS